MSKHGVLYVLLAVAGLLSAVPSHAATRPAMLAEIITAAPVSVDCTTTRGAWYAIPAVAELHARGEEVGGVAFLGEARLAVDPETCIGVSRVPRTKSQAARSGNDLMTLAHEATHLQLDSGDERLVECVAGRNVWRLIVAGVPARLRAAAYRAAMESHNGVASDPAYGWHGAC